MKTVTVAVIGAGFAGNFHCNAYKKVNTVQVRLKTIVDNQPERANVLKDRWGFEIATDDYESVLADTEIDLIDITLPPVLHIPYAVRALKAGKHVACEKPLTGYFGKPEDTAPIGLTVSKRKMFETLMQEMEEVKQAVAESSAQFMYAENYVYSPAVVKAAEILRHRKTRVIFVGKLPDHTDDISSTKDIPSWKRMCYCILKNDHTCRFMGFGLSREEQRRINFIKKQYGGWINE